MLIIVWASTLPIFRFQISPPRPPIAAFRRKIRTVSIPAIQLEKSATILFRLFLDGIVEEEVE